MLKIRKNGGAPDVMITMLNEEEAPATGEEESKEPAAQDPMQFINQLM
jgi:2-iminoacetate synthase ThiH